MSTIRPPTPVSPNSIYEQMDPDDLVEMDECVYCFASTDGGCHCILDETEEIDDEGTESDEEESSDYDSVDEEERYISSVIAQVNSLNIPAPLVTRYTAHFPPDRFPPA